MAFDAKEYMQTRNESEAAIRAGKAPEVKPAAVVAPVALEDDPNADDQANAEKHIPQVPRSVRRELNRLREAKAAAEAKLQVYETLGRKPEAAAEPQVEVKATDPEPQRKDFPEGEAGRDQYNRACGKWDARQEATKVVDTKDQEAQRLADLRREIDEADAQAKLDTEIFPDWAKKKKAAEALAIDFSDQPNLPHMLATSGVRSKLLYYFADGHGEELQKLLDLKGKPMAQDRFFRKLEGRVETMYTTQQKKKELEAHTETAAERDAKKHRPSAADAPKGGSAPVTTISPMNPDGTVNQAWLAQRNERSGRR